MAGKVAIVAGETGETVQAFRSNEDPRLVFLAVNENTEVADGGVAATLLDAETARTLGLELVRLAAEVEAL